MAVDRRAETVLADVMTCVPTDESAAGWLDWPDSGASLLWSVECADLSGLIRNMVGGSSVLYNSWRGHDRIHATSGRCYVPQPQWHRCRFQAHCLPSSRAVFDLVNRCEHKRPINPDLWVLTNVRPTDLSTLVPWSLVYSSFCDRADRKHRHEMRSVFPGIV